MYCKTEISERSKLFEGLWIPPQAKIYTIYDGRLSSSLESLKPESSENEENFLEKTVEIKLEGGSEIPVFLIHIDSNTRNRKRDSNSSENAQKIFHTNIELEAKSEITLIEYHFTVMEDSAECPNLQTPKPQYNTQIRLHPGSKLQHYLLKSNEISQYEKSIQIQQTENTQYEVKYLALPGLGNHTLFNIHLQAVNAHCDVQALLLPASSQTTALDLNIHHHQARCESRCIARTIVPSHAKAKFSGKIHVFPEAKQTLAHLENKSLLLSETAEVFTKPEFEIYQEDLRCSHGATVGHLDKSALFYLQSRGIAAHEAKQMLLNAFMQPVIGNITLPSLKPFFQKLEALSL